MAELLAVDTCQPIHKGLPYNIVMLHSLEFGGQESAQFGNLLDLAVEELAESADPLAGGAVDHSVTNIK